MSRFSTEHRNHGSLFVGGALVLAGTVLLLSRLGYLGAIRPWQFWPLLMIWSGTLQVLGLHGHGARFGGMLQIGIGAGFQAFYLGLLPLHADAAWPLALIALGVYVVFRGGRRRKHCHGRQACGGATPCNDASLQRRILFSGRAERITNRQFQGGSIECTLGGLQLDFTGAEIEGDEAVLHLDVSMGGVEIRVPRHWKVVVEAEMVLGGTEDRSHVDDALTAQKRLRITGRVLMGGVEIKN